MAAKHNGGVLAINAGSSSLKFALSRAVTSRVVHGGPRRRKSHRVDAEPVSAANEAGVPVVNPATNRLTFLHLRTSEAPGQIHSPHQPNHKLGAFV